MEFDHIGGWSQADLRRFIVNLLVNEPGVVPQPAATPQLPSPANDGDVPVWDQASQSWVTSTQHKVPESDLASWPMTYFKIDSSGYSAAPDLAFRFFTNGTLSFDNHNTPSSWITNAANGSFQFPDTNTYIVAFGKYINNAEGGTMALFLRDATAGTLPFYGFRDTINAGSDPSANLPRSGPSVGPVLVTPTSGHTYSFGGYWNGSSVFSIWFFAMRIPY